MHALVAATPALAFAPMTALAGDAAKALAIMSWETPAKTEVRINRVCIIASPFAFLTL
jgi:hypothetical protein